MRWQYLPLIFATGLNAFNRGYPDQVVSANTCLATKLTAC